MSYDYVDLDGQLSKEDKMFKKSVREFAEKEIRPISLELDKIEDPNDKTAYNPLFDKMCKKIREMDFHLALFPEEVGGLGLTPLQYQIFLEEIGYASAGTAVFSVVDQFPSLVALKTGRQDIIDEFAMPFIEDRDLKLRGAWCGTEPDHGSDFANLSHDHFNNLDISLDMRGELDGDYYVVNGQKSAWVSNGPASTCGLLYVNIQPEKGMAGTATFIVPLDMPGISKGPALDKIGQRDLPQGEVFFNDVKIPAKYMIFPPEYFHDTFEQTLALGNTTMAATFTGLARAAFEEALTYAKGRVQGGKVICKHQLIQKKLFDMFMKVETCRSVSRTIMKHNLLNPAPSLAHAAAAKVFVTQSCLEICSEAVQILGGYGLTREFVVEKFFRDARSSLIEDGTNETLALDAADWVIRNYK